MNTTKTMKSKQEIGPSSTLSKLPWAVKHIFDKDDRDRNEARAIVEALGLRTFYDEYSVSQSEEIYVVLGILYAANARFLYGEYGNCDPEIMNKITQVFEDEMECVIQFWAQLYAESPDASRDHYNTWELKHPVLDGIPSGLVTYRQRN